MHSMALIRGCDRARAEPHHVERPVPDHFFDNKADFGLMQALTLSCMVCAVQAAAMALPGNAYLICAPEGPLDVSPFCSFLVPSPAFIRIPLHWQLLLAE